MAKQMIAVVLSAVLLTSGCASAGAPRVSQNPPAAVDRTVMADYVQRIPIGSRVRLERADGPALRGTLMKAGADSVTVQRNTRVPEAPVEIPLASITRLTLDQGSSSVGRNIGIGIASGVGATFGVLLLLAAIFSD